VTSRLRALALFAYDFVVGDDWRVAVGVVLALTATYLVTLTSAPAWWVLPVTVVGLLWFSLRRATRAKP
jgi:hypothetical protein